MKLKNIKVTRTMEYDPEAYLKCCEEARNIPTQDGFMEFIQDWIDEDFRNNKGSEDISLIEYNEE